MDHAITLPAPGYELGEVIGRGGMGEVVAARDRRIGRNVALKRMHGVPTARATARFLREARIQALLDHPAIVPVHELSVDELGRPFFTMKRLNGDTLAEVIAGQRTSTPALLRAFSEVCMAIALAHTRGVIHRDLKPANIMLGEFGEVYVLDWGVARVVDERGSDTELAGDSATALPTQPPVVAGVATADTIPADDRETQASRSDGVPPASGFDDPIRLKTRAGVMLGTPGYAAPEQVRGEPIGPPADVYALGAVLYEILTATPLHPEGETALLATLSGDVEPPTKRAPDRAIAPELDELCVRALADAPSDRPTARELAERLQSYLDGDRDLERRRTLAREQLALARAATDRMAALRLAGRALALDPESEAAAAEVTRLVVERPSELPAGLVDELRARESETLAIRSRRAARSYSVALALLIVLPLIGVHSWATWGGIVVALVFMIGFAARGARTGAIPPWLSMIGNGVVALAWSRIASPLVLAPAMICGASIAIASHPWNQRRPWTLFAWAGVTIAAPLVLEATGVFATTWWTADGGLTIRSAVIDLAATGSPAFVLATHSAFVLLVAGFAYTVTRRAFAAEHDLYVQAWHLRHLLPASRGLRIDA